MGKEGRKGRGKGREGVEGKWGREAPIIYYILSLGFLEICLEAVPALSRDSRKMFYAENAANNTQCSIGHACIIMAI